MKSVNKFQDPLLERLVRNYMYQLKIPPPRSWDFTAWKDYVYWIQWNDPLAYNKLRILDKWHDNLIFILVGKVAENYAALLDRTKHDVRDYEPYFYPEDKVKWQIR